MKTAGVFVLSLIPLILSFKMGTELRQKMNRQKAFFEFLSYVYFQIENFNRNQKEIIKGFDHKVFRETNFFITLQEQIDENTCSAFRSAWETFGEEFGFDSATEELLTRLANHFGLQERVSQLQELDGAVKLLEKKLEQSQSDFENKIKILRMSGITAGLGILILLL